MWKRWLLFTLILGLLSLSSVGCGNKGDLYIPEPETATADASAAADSDEQSDDEDEDQDEDAPNS